MTIRVSVEILVFVMPGGDVRPWGGLADVAVQPSIVEMYWELLKFQGGICFTSCNVESDFCSFAIKS